MALTFCLLDSPHIGPAILEKNPDLIDFGITKNIDRGALSAEISYKIYVPITQL